ncbi:MAG: hypothetical protein LBI27_01515 [Clostridiales bacterium]|jgi:hypothetical protein|nr:hypothetical protein [Clostridiales bacterium]
MKNMFAGVNTPVGFVNFFDNIMPLERAKQRIFLKGPNGSGKSTFIKKIVAEFQTAGFSTELFRCANDAESLDAMASPERGFCIIDATAPHARDPELPAAIDRIIDFTQFTDEKKIIPHTDEIKSLIIQKKSLSEKARGYFAAVGNIYSAEKNFSKTVLTRKCLEFFDGSEASQNPGSDRKLFLTAVTPDGVISFADKFFAECIMHDTDIPLTALRDEANMRGISTESFCDPFAPTQIEYLFLPQKKIAFVTERNINNELFNKILDHTVFLLHTSRTQHIKIEEIYFNAIDFDKINAFTEEIILQFDTQ